MSVYHHENFIPLEPNTKIWRYFDIEKYKSLLETRALFFCRADKFSDPFEGSLPKIEAEHRIKQEIQIANHFGRPFDEQHALKNILGTQNLHQRLKSGTLINCWHINQNESDAMWRLYLKDNEGVAIQSNTEKMYQTIEMTSEKVGLSKVRYLNYETDRWYHTEDYPHKSYNLYIPLIHKRIEFSHENEFRLIHDIHEPVDNENYWDSQPNNEGTFIQIDLKSLIEKIYLPPTIDIKSIKKIQNLTALHGYDFGFESSKLSTKPIF